MIKILAKEDKQLDTLLEEAQEHAQLYLLAKQRQKGCDETGEVATLKKEFRWTVEKILKYCKENSFSSVDSSYDLESIAYAMQKRTIT